MINLDSNIVQEGKDKLITQYYRSENIEKVLEIGLDLLQDAETIAHSLYENRTIENAVGVQLDGVGAIVGQPRNGLDDSFYRTQIKAKIAENNSEGTREEIINLAKLLVEDATIQILESQALYILTFLRANVDTDNSENWSIRRQAITNATCSGITVEIQEASNIPFQYGGLYGYGQGHYAIGR